MLNELYFHRLKKRNKNNYKKKETKKNAVLEVAKKINCSLQCARIAIQQNKIPNVFFTENKIRKSYWRYA